MAGLVATPVTKAQANAFVAEQHRHHSPLNDAIFVCGTSLDGNLVGVAMVSRPCAHSMEDGTTCEVRRVATDGTHNACSFLYGLCRSVAFKLGFRRVLTYTMETESGSSPRAAGFVETGRTDGRSNWSNRIKGRRGGVVPRRVGSQALQDRLRQGGVKIRWESSLARMNP